MKKQKTDKKILNKVEFSFEDEQYIAQTYITNKEHIYAEIVYAKTKQQVRGKMRHIARSILKQYGIKVPTDSKTMVTHQAIKTLINVLQTENKKR